LLVGKQSTESAASFERWLQRRQARQPHETAEPSAAPDCLQRPLVPCSRFRQRAPFNRTER
jgi:hypothetical protein